MLFLLGLGFIVGLSGAMIPGPLLIYTINESLHRGKWTGVMVIIGHAIVEVLVFLLLMFGLMELISSGIFLKAISIIGGLALILMALQSIKNIRSEVKIQATKMKYGVVIGGIIFTALNPSFPIWWATAGTRLLLEGLQVMGFIGMMLVFLGHLGADFGWFLLVSMTTSKSSSFLFEKGWYANVRVFLSLMLFAIGLYFFLSGL